MRCLSIVPLTYRVRDASRPTRTLLNAGFLRRANNGRARCPANYWSSIRLSGLCLAPSATCSKRSVCMLYSAAMRVAPATTMLISL